MDNIEELIKQIIPEVKRPDQRDREWFSNDEILSKLNKEDLEFVEKRLLEKLQISDDLLISQTLVKMKSVKAIPVMLEKLASAKDSFDKIQWASFINELNQGDEEMEKKAFKALEKIEFIYEVQGIIFYDLIKFNSPRINGLIKEYIDHKYFLVAYHAKKALGLT